MSRSIKVCSIIFFVAFQTMWGQGSSFFERSFRIIPLISNKDSVTREFGAASNNTNYFFEKYKSGDTILSFEYSRGNCAKNPSSSWDVNEYIVTRIFLEFRKPVQLSKLGLNTKGFEKNVSSDVNGAYQLELEREGISIDVNSRGQVEAIERSPATIFDVLLCANRR